MEIIIPAGGKGMRMRPLTLDIPKPLLPVCGKTVLERTVENLRRFTGDRITFTVGYKGAQTVNYLTRLPYKNLRCFVERAPLGSCGGVKPCIGKAEHFIVASGDCLSDIDYNALYDSHVRSRADITIAATRSATPWLYGVIDCDSDNRVRAFYEKPDSALPGSLVNIGIYCISGYVKDLIPTDAPFDFARDLFPLVLSFGKINVYRHNGYWRDIGDLTSYYLANYEHKTNDGNHVCDCATVDGDIENCIVNEGCYIDKTSVLKDCIVMPNTTVYGIHNRCIISNRAALPVCHEKVDLTVTAAHIAADQKTAF